MDIFNLFIVFPKETEETSVADIVTDEVAYEAYLNKLKTLINRADCEKGVTLFYDKSERNIFITNYLKLASDLVESYLIDPYIIINDLLRNSVDFTKKEQKQQENCFYALWDFDSLSVVTKMPSSVKEAFEYEMSSIEDSKQLLLNLGTEFYPLKKDVFIFKDASNYNNQEMPTFLKLGQVCNHKDLEDWFIKNRTPRKLNTTDQRHNEKSRQYIKEKSPILYDLKLDINEKFVQNLLTQALGDQFAEQHSKDLMNYDDTKERYIWFEYQNENPQNEYHAYHLAKPLTHEPDLVAISKIPKRAKKLIDKKIP